MFVCINKCLLGTKKHLISCTKSDQTYWGEDFPQGSWVLGESYDNFRLSEVLQILKKDVTQIFPKKFANSFSSLNLEHTTMPAHMCMPSYVFKQCVQNVVEDAQNALETLESAGYIQTLKTSQKVLLSLTKSFVDEQKIKRYIQESSSGPSVVSSLRSFIPKSGEFCDPVKYSLSRTVTGRMVVESGPSILTLTAKYRDILRSKYKGGKIVQIDFISLEPRVCRYIAGLDSAKDIYDDISLKIFQKKYERKVVKLAVLCALYGVSTKKLANFLSSESEARRVVKKVRKYFSLAELERKLLNQLMATKKISNFYGRPLQTDVFDSHVLVSHFVQSTSVDVALSGFYEIIKATGDRNIDPIFLIHDAILFDVDTEGFEFLQSVASQGVDLDIGHFPTSLEIISTRDDI